MYEEQTEKVIGDRILRRMPKSIDKREGSIAYDAAYPAAIEFMLLYAVIDFFYKNTFGDTADREHLIERAKERGLSPYAASNAVVTLECSPAGISIPLGSRFSVDELNYIVRSKVTDSTNRYLAECETPGTIGNKASGRAIPIDYVQGLEFAKIVEVERPGEDEEETEAFRTRYLKSFETQAYGGNIADYQEKDGEIQGVGGVKVYPVWNGGGTVKVVFTTSENKIPASELVSEVQEALDPVPYAQEGVGIAPIGHRVTVEGAVSSAVNIGLKIKFFGSETYEKNKSDIEQTIQNYFSELNKKWQNTEIVTTQLFENKGIIVRISQIESRLLNRPYVADISHTTLNGNEENLELADNALATIGEISCTTVTEA